MNINDMPQHVRFVWTFLRRHTVVEVHPMMDSHQRRDLMTLCEIELAQLAVDANGKPICFFLRCATDAMFPEKKS